MRIVLFLLLLVLPCAGAEIFGGAEIAGLYRVRLDRGDLLLETIQDVIQQNGIADGAVLTAAGSLQECTFHRVKSLAEKPEQEFSTVKEPMEILNISGLIAGGEPHLHTTLSGAHGAFGGHLEKGCRVLYRAELTIAKFSGTPLARVPNKAGVPVLQRK
ncbi:MAG: DNA-binding protein [Acidobacteriia bacterium]|nr:DNA-binding protein [Terriglobia bacterium]